MAEEATLEGSDPTLFRVYFPAKHLVMPGWLAIDPAPYTLYSFLHLHRPGTELSLLLQESRVYNSLCVSATRESSLVYCRLTGESGWCWPCSPRQPYMSSPQKMPIIAEFEEQLIWVNFRAFKKEILHQNNPSLLEDNMSFTWKTDLHSSVFLVSLMSYCSGDSSLRSL